MPGGNIGLTPQQQQQLLSKLKTEMKQMPIPQVLLSKVQGIPPGVKNWQQVFDLIQSKVIPQQVLPALRNLHNTHLQVLFK
ncbi:hypothetical protein BABINDRAFT_38852, partial [Babjeviella inositovora NRRL Y-12698]